MSGGKSSGSERCMTILVDKKYEACGMDFMKKKLLSALSSSEIEELNALYEGLVQMSRSDAEHAEKKIKKYLELRDFTGNENLKYRLMMKLGEYYGRNGEVEESSSYFEKLRDIATINKDDALLRRSLANLGITMAQRDLYREALDIWHELLAGEPELERRLSLLNNICVASGIIGEYHEAIQAAFTVVNLTDDQEMINHRADAMQNLGAIYDKMGEPEKALDYWLKTLELNKVNGTVRREFEVLGNISLAYVRLGEYEKALSYAMSSIKIRKKHLPEESLGIGYNNIGYIYESAGNLKKALDYYKKGESFYQSLSRNSALAHCYLNQASLFFRMGEPQKSLELLEEASRIENAHNALQNKIQLVKLYADVHQAMGNYHLAYEYLLEHNQILQEELEKKRNTTISVKEADYYRNKIENQARDYLAQNKELKKKNRMISKTTRELKEINRSLAETVDVLNWLISVISHDVRAPLANFGKMLEMMINGDFPASEHREILLSMKNGSDGIFKLINDMLDGIRLQKQKMDFNTSISFQNIVPILGSVLEIYQPMARQKQINLEFKPETVSITAYVDSDLLKILVRNLLNNAMKFTESGGSVVIEARNIQKHASIVIEDSGIGMKASAIADLRKGKGIRRSSSDGGVGLGLVLCQDALKRMKGKLFLQSELGQGTRVEIHLPAE